MDLKIGTVIIIGVIIVALVVFAFIIKDGIAKTNVMEIIKSHFPNARIVKLSKCLCKVIEGEDIYYFHYIMIPSNSMITINYLYTWQLFYGGDREKKGRAYPNTRFITEIEDFCKMEVEENAKKVCIIYKDTEHINMYINENELVEIDVYVKKYGYNLVRYNYFDSDIKKAK